MAIIRNFTFSFSQMEDEFVSMEEFLSSAVSYLQAMLSTGQAEQRRVIDPAVLASSSQESLSTAISITSKCLSQEPSHPSIEDVLWNLQYAAQVQSMADGDQKSDILSQA